MISDVFDYARSRMKALGFKEWAGGFALDNVPRTILDGTYSVQMNQVTGLSVSQDGQELEVPFTVRIYSAPGRDPSGLIDSMISKVDLVVSDFLKASHRTLHAGVKNIGFNSMVLEQLANSNDNGVIGVINFSAFVLISTR